MIHDGDFLATGQEIGPPHPTGIPAGWGGTTVTNGIPPRSGPELRLSGPAAPGRSADSDDPVYLSALLRTGVSRRPPARIDL
ncbi:hypothetical protein AADR41_01765 [Streptomyces sp. CLV115]|uniref:hypothetical protein n=1 Tax=Streptomyces sp. CLV115 TaxID=3138502 RepID=UPI00313B3397